MFLLFQGCPAASIGMIPTHREGRVTQRSGRGVRGVRASVRAKTRSMGVRVRRKETQNGDAERRPFTQAPADRGAPPIDARSRTQCGPSNGA